MSRTKLGETGRITKAGIAMIIFIVLIGLVGSLYLYASHADTYCVDQSFTSSNADSYNACVGYAQEMLNDDSWLWHWNGGTIATSGYFNQSTSNEVVSLQKYYNNSDVNGNLDPSTWQALCYVHSENNSSTNSSAKAVWIQAGCNHEAQANWAS